MKPILKSILFFVALLFSMSVAANEIKTKLTTEANSKYLTFEYNTNGQEIKLKLIDNNDVVIYFENIEDVETYKKKFDFSELETGKYVLTVESELKYTVHSFTIGENAIELNGVKESNKPYFKATDKRIGINFLNLEADAILITIYDSEHRKVFNEEFTDVLMEKSINFENAFADDYLIVFKTAQKTYSKSILIK